MGTFPKGVLEKAGAYKISVGDMDCSAIPDGMRPWRVAKGRYDIPEGWNATIDRYTSTRSLCAAVLLSGKDRQDGV